MKTQIAKEVVKLGFVLVTAILLPTARRIGDNLVRLKKDGTYE